MSVNFLASKNFFKGPCKALIFKKKIRGCSREIDLMKKGLRLGARPPTITNAPLEKLT